MRWEDALALAEDLEARSKQAAYELSHRYLEKGTAHLAGEEAWLRRAVDRLSPQGQLPEALSRRPFAWKNATYMAQRRID